MANHAYAARAAYKPHVCWLHAFVNSNLYRRANGTTIKYLKK